MLSFKDLIATHCVCMCREIGDTFVFGFPLKDHTEITVNFAFSKSFDCQIFLDYMSINSQSHLGTIADSEIKEQRGEIFELAEENFSGSGARTGDSMSLEYIENILGLNDVLTKG